MPLTRYQIRNEYSLADPELYRAADKDDPEALLEGVAMAGLVGVLRQLGDLAEFAAQIFHDLHEEVMATASRGHGLMLRVQQLEAEVPSIEKAFLTQTSPSLFLLNAGVGWRSNLRMDENLITREDLPRCVMDSYEECRGPPRLFLLDKFDVAGAGACLKRYSDPSFFKAEFTSSEAMGADIQKEKRAHKVKKKGSRWRNGENPEVYPTSHAKLHQLLSEERNSDNNVLMHHVKLKKRQLNGFLSESTAGKSYMERFLETNSPETKISCENSLVLPQLNMESSNTCEHDLEICEIGTASPASKLMQRERDLHLSAERQETALEQSMYNLREDVIKEGILEKLHEPMCDIEVEKLPSSVYKLEDRKELVVDVECQKEVSVDGYQSDDIPSEVDNYMDALATMESEMETDTDSRQNNDRGFFNIKRLGMDSDTKEEQQKHQDQFSGSHSIGNSSESDEYNLFRKGRYHPSNMSTLNNLAVKEPPGHDAVAEGATSTGTCPSKIVDASTEKPYANDYTFVTDSLEYVVPSGSCIELSEIPSSASELIETSPDSCVTDSTSIISHHLSRGANLNEFQLQGQDFVGHPTACMRFSTEASSPNTEVEIENIRDDEPSTTNLSDSASKMKDDPLAVGFVKSQELDVVDGLTHPELSSYALLHQSDISGLRVEGKYDGDTLEAAPPTKYAESSAKKPKCLSATTSSDDLDNLQLDDMETGSVHVEAGSETVVCQRLIGSPSRNHIKSEDKCPSSNGNVSDIESKIHSELDNLVSGAAHTDDADTADSLNLIGSPSGIQINLQEECVRDLGSEHCKVETIQAYIAEDAEKERNQLPTSSSDLNVEVYSSQSHIPSSSEIPYDVHDAMLDAMPVKCDQALHLGDSTGTLTSSIETDQKLQFSHRNQPSEGAKDAVFTSLSHKDLTIPPEQALVLEAGPLLSNLQDEQTEFLKGKDQNGGPGVPSETSWVEKLEPVKHRGLDSSSGSPKSSSIEPLKQPLEPTIDPLASVSPSFGMLSGTTHEQPLKPQPSGSALAFSSQGANAAQANLEASLLPPLPPKGRRAGKLLHSLPTSEGEMVQPSLNPFLPSPTEDEKHEHDLIILKEEKTQPSLNSFAPPTATEEVRPASDTPQGEAGDLENLSVLKLNIKDGTLQPQIIEDEEPLNSFATSTIKVEQPLNDEFASPTIKAEELLNASAPPTMKDEEPSRSSLTLEGEMPSNASTSLPDAEVGVPNGKPPRKLPRPRDPLIEAVASHDRNTLRKVTERIRPQIVQKMEERDSMLEQIRTKSFNLKPAARSMVSTRSMIQGPRTNLKVAAILEKANAIRQATAGSDEDDDDDDSWSDS